MENKQKLCYWVLALVLPRMEHSKAVFTLDIVHIPSLALWCTAIGLHLVSAYSKLHTVPGSQRILVYEGSFSLPLEGGMVSDYCLMGHSRTLQSHKVVTQSPPENYSVSCLLACKGLHHQGSLLGAP